MSFTLLVKYKITILPHKHQCEPANLQSPILRNQNQVLLEAAWPEVQQDINMAVPMAVTNATKTK